MNGMQEREAPRILEQGADDRDRVQDQEGVLGRDAALRIRREEAPIGQGQRGHHQAEKDREPGRRLHLAAGEVLPQPERSHGDAEDGPPQRPVALMLRSLGHVLGAQVVGEPA